MPKGIYPRTEYHKSILSKAKLGKPKSDEWKAKHRQAMAKFKGIPRTKEVRDKISRILTGRKLSLEHRLNISLVQKGKKKPPRTNEHRENNAVHSRGANSHWWKDGRTELKKQIKNLVLYREWREAVFRRDNWTCVWCQVRGRTELSPDHIKPLSQILDENNITTQEDAKNCSELWDVNNGRTLCHPCHKKTDTYGWKIYNRR